MYVGSERKFWRTYMLSHKTVGQVEGLERGQDYWGSSNRITK